MNVLVACESSGVVRDAFRLRGHSAWSCDLLPTESKPHLHIQGDAIDAITQGRPTDGARWNMVIAHPPCTYLCSSGMHWTTRGLRDPQLTEDAIAFVNALFQSTIDCKINMLAIENPIGCISSRIRKPDQIIQPWMFGDNASKQTCLWLRGLPLLTPTKIMPPKGWSVVRYASDMIECPDCGEPYCQECGDHYADCDCIGPTEDDCTRKTINGIEFGCRKSQAPRPIWSNQTPGGQNKLGPSPDRWKLRSKTYQGIADAMAEQWGRIRS